MWILKKAKQNNAPMATDNRLGAARWLGGGEGARVTSG